MKEILHDFTYRTYKNSRDYGSRFCMVSCRIYIINRITIIYRILVKGIIQLLLQYWGTVTVEARKVEHAPPPTPDLRKKEHQHKSSVLESSV